MRSEISYGLPFEISQPGKYVDDVETESLEFASQIDSYRGLAGTAHIYDLAPQLLEEDFVDYRDGELLPDGPGYKGLIIYQDVLPLSSARKILGLAKKGLPVLFVNGCTEMVRPGYNRTYTKAASMTPFNDGNDERLAAVVAEIKALPNVCEI